MQLTLAYCPIACSMVPYILLVEAGAAFDVLKVNLFKNKHNTPEYLSINPKAKVPALIVNGDPLTENVAIQLWIDRQFPEANLMPRDSMAYHKAIAVLSWCSSAIHPKLTQQARPERYCAMPHTSDDVRALGASAMLDLFALADQQLAGRQWFFEHFTCADAYFYWCFRRGVQFHSDALKFSHCVEHMNRMDQRPSVQKLLAFEAQVQAEFAQMS
jgi:glutathione S-transferase